MFTEIPTPKVTMNQMSADAGDGTAVDDEEDAEDYRTTPRGTYTELIKALFFKQVRIPIL